jgi:hypothetical protein
MHRKLATTASARELRDARYIFGEDEYWIDETQRAAKQRAAKTSSFGGVAILAGLVLLAAIWLPGIGSDNSIPRDHDGNAFTPDSLWAKARSLMPSSSRPVVKLTEDFHSGLDDWQSSPREAGQARSAGGLGSWVVHAGAVQPKELRLWTPSMKLKNYDLDFQAQIEHRAIGWAFRAKDFQNYYAAKIVLSRPAPFPVSEIVRYAVLNGKEQARAQLPLPMQLQRGTLYQVNVKIAGNKFITMVNGAVVDTWEDARIKSGGIGFFAEKGEVASIMGVQVGEERGVLERMFLPAMIAGPMSW